VSCYDKFEAKVRAYYDTPENIEYDIGCNKLRNKGYSKEESHSYYRWLGEVRRIELQAPFSFIQTLLAKYAIILSRFDLNENARTILSNLITDWLDKALHQVLSCR
jgi:hypothetical protein